MTNIIDDKVCCYRVGGTAIWRKNRWDYLRNRVHHGQNIESKTVKGWFCRRQLRDTELPHR